jgi:hypothetical protein
MKCQSNYTNPIQHWWYHNGIWCDNHSPCESPCAVSCDLCLFSGLCSKRRAIHRIRSLGRWQLCKYAPRNVFNPKSDLQQVDNVPMAGRIFISQLIAGAGAGVVASVNTDGTMNIAGGPTLRINTPNGVYAKAYTSQPFLTSDEENPSISSFSGYPMCLPRSANDPDCPTDNRAANGDRV